MTEQEIKDIRDSVDKKRQSIAQAEGKRLAMMERLKTEHSVDTVEAGEALVTEMEATITTDKEKLGTLEDQLNVLKQEMDTPANA